MTSVVEKGIPCCKPMQRPEGPVGNGKELQRLCYMKKKKNTGVNFFWRKGISEFVCVKNESKAAVHKFLNNFKEMFNNQIW